MCLAIFFRREIPGDVSPDPETNRHVELSRVRGDTGAWLNGTLFEERCPRMFVS